MPELKAPTWIELESNLPLESSDPEKLTVKKITNLSSDTIKRRYPEYVTKLSQRREAMKLRHALKIANGQ
jgi:hypothetical protein